MKRLLLVVLILVVLVGTILFYILNKPFSFIKPETARGRTFKEELQPKAADSSAVSKSPTQGLLLPQVTMTAVDYKVDLFALNRERENPPFEFRGGAGTGRVIDRQGNVLLSSNDEIAIFGAAISPDKEKVLVKGGNAINLVLEVSTGRKIKLPSLPPGSNMLGFGDWHWIGSDLLFGTSGVERVLHEGPHKNCCNENNVAQTKFYTFDLITERLSEVVMPDAVTRPLVNAADVTSDGHIHLLHEDPLDGVDSDLGWFKIDASK